MKKYLTALSTTLFLLGSLVFLPASAAQAADYSSSHLMDDGVFDNVGTMSEPQIYNFLVSKGPCLANYADADPNYSSSTGWSYSGSVSAAHIIFKTAQMWGLNPQVILATLQKEESLITGTSCDNWRYNAAMGYGCPDSGGCNPKYAGFTRQVLWGSWQLKFSKERSLGNTAWDGDGDISYVGYMTQGTRKRCASCSPNYYDGTAVIDGQTIFLETGATAAFYTYTPHLGQSLPGLFESWFGSVLYHGNDPVGSFDLVQQQPGMIRVAGWGIDRNQTAAVPVHVYVDGNWVGAVTADTSRPDVGNTYPYNGNNHGFDGTVSWTGSGNHQVCLWVVGDSLGAPNAGLGCHTVSINNDPTGSYDVVAQSPSAVRVAGWGFDRSTVDPASVHVYIDGTWKGALTANVSRPDVGPRGFDGTVSWTGSGNHQVCLWVVGDSLGAPNAGLGCRTVSVNNDPIGSFDVLQKQAGSMRVAGWGLDRSLASPAAVHFYIDGQWVAAFSANINRPDVGPHAFDGAISWSTTGNHQICAWVVGDSVGAPNAGLGCKNFTY